MKNIVHFAFLCTVVIAILATTTVNAADRNYRPMVVFGDSLVDVGNLPPMLFLSPSGEPGLVIPPPTRYDRGRFSNGPNIADYIALKLGTFLKPSNTGTGLLDSIGFGHGGATTYESNLTPGGFPVPGVLGQVSQFLNSAPDTQIDSRTLIVINAGANDYLLGLLQPSDTPSIDVSTTVNNLRSSINQLYSRGARKFVVFNLPDLSKIPVCLTFNICPPLGSLTLDHNTLLASALQDIKAEFSDILIADIDFFTLFRKITKNPGLYGFTGSWQTNGPASGCLLQDPATFNPANCGPLQTFNTSLIFWDEQHATSQAYQLIADIAYLIIKNKLF